MIKVSFCSRNAVDDVCVILENELTHHIDIDEWLVKEIPTLRFDCMDYPYDLEFAYDCYFKTGDDIKALDELSNLLDLKLKDIKRVDFSICIVDEY
ncbi:MAG: hypothetical protein RR585_15970 [Coprobacillus sp.]